MALQGLNFFVDDVVFQACFLNILNIGFVICCVELPEREHRAQEAPEREHQAQEAPERKNRAQEAPEREN